LVLYALVDWNLFVVLRCFAASCLLIIH